MAFEAKDLAFKIVGDTAEDVLVNPQPNPYLDLRIACGTGTNPTMVDFQGKVDQGNLEALHKAMQITLNQIANKLGVPVPKLDP